MLRSVPRTVDAPATLPYGSAVGYLAYELGRFTEPGRDGRPPAPDGPLAVLSRYDPVLAYDRSRAQYTLVCAEPASARVPWLERLAAPAPAWGGPLATAPLAPLLPRARYLAAVRRILDYLAAGDVYQVNLTQPYAAPLAAPAWALFAARARRHPTVPPLVSSVVARVGRDVGLARLLRATFPGGSITGAPKVRAMEIIRELEPVPRGAYTGAFGLFHPSGDLELGLAIRTAVVAGGVVRYHAGGGIVADSDPERELAEAWLKTAALRLALGEDARPELERCSSG